MKTKLLLILLLLVCQSCKRENIIVHDFYVVSYNSKKNNPNWVAWKIGQTNIFKRTGLTFRLDPKVKTVDASVYEKSGYDLGHICPANDMSFNRKALTESFYMSNVSPQNPNLNRGDWKELETFLHKEGKLTNVYCVAGPFWNLTETNKLKNQVLIPSAFWKVAYGGTGEMRKAWFFTNAANNKVLLEYEIDIDKLKKMTKIDFDNCTNILIKNLNMGM